MKLLAEMNVLVKLPVLIVATAMPSTMIRVCPLPVPLTTTECHWSVVKVVPMTLKSVVLPLFVRIRNDNLLFVEKPSTIRSLPVRVDKSMMLAPGVCVATPLSLMRALKMKLASLTVRLVPREAYWDKLLSSDKLFGGADR